MPEIQLTRGRVALVDDEDFARVSSFRWSAQRGGRSWYAQSSLGVTGVGINLHRFIMQPPSGMEVDHINGDGLDNRRCNLRVCSHAENLRNRRKNAGASSRFKGVWLSRGKWRAGIEKDDANIYLGAYDTEEAAARQYDRAARLLFGQFAKTNADLGLLQR